MYLLFEVVLRFGKISCDLFHTAQLDTTPIQNLVRCSEVVLDLLPSLFDLLNIFTHLLLIDRVIGLLLLLHALPT